MHQERISLTAFLVQLLNLLLLAVIIAGAVCLLLLAVRALKKRNAAAPKEAATAPRTLSEALKAQRTAHGMTQEYVAEALGVSRQAVSKWESGASVPSTANLKALAALYGIAPEKLLAK